ncbi:RNA polymerase sigma factor SigE [Arsenicicoccus piscis]|uniref:RNA polymerase sigma factor SigE n=1 Tax=Arsenicicoccus piscis TaxID=673954 RepID=A0ABQ6HJ84_9MICO|nr:RNA polymerase sigma factor SigE [Arsenicicoccus piscis]MCH8628206.1 RNA polymerase sigma factor SigE [Arsenicicoccus piscis]GMA18447.1 RNA polymerase sigma factor SigE [Arsenicicoccus piscis]
MTAVTTTTDHRSTTDRSDLPAGATASGAEWVPPTWAEIVEQHSARVYRLSYRLTGNQHDAEDLTHDVFLRVFRSLDSYRPGTFEGWLHRITTNVFLDRMRRKQRIRFDALSDDASARLVSREAGPAQTYADTHFDDDVQRALDALSPEFRAAVVLCDIEGLTYEEIADVLDIKLGTVRSRIHRGRSQLRAALAHRDPALRRAEAEQARAVAADRSRLRLPGRGTAAGLTGGLGPVAPAL